MEKYLRTESERTEALDVLRQHPLPFVLTIKDKRKRRDEQNALYQRWCRDVSEQSGYSMEEVHYIVKTRWGIPLLVRDNPEDAHDYGLVVKMLDGVEKDEAVRLMDRLVRVTSHLTVKQMTELLDDFQRYFSEHFELTDPERVV